MSLEKQLVSIVKQIQDEKRLGDKRAEQFYNTVWAVNPAVGEYAKFTATGLEGRSYSEVLSDLSGQAGAAFDWNTQDLYNIGGITAWGDFSILREAISTSCTIKVWSSGAGWHAPVFRFFRGRGTQAAPVAILNNDSMCVMPIVGQYDGANTYEGGKILWQAAENWDNLNRGITYRIQGTNLGAVALSDWLTIEDGKAVFADTINASGSITTGAWLASSAGTPGVQFYENDVGANLKYMDIIASGGQISFRCVNDAYTLAETYLEINRNALSHTIANVKIPNGYFYITDMRSGATQAGAGASAGELWKTASHASLPDNIVMVGV